MSEHTPARPDNEPIRVRGAALFPHGMGPREIYWRHKLLFSAPGWESEWRELMPKIDVLDVRAARKELAEAGIEVTDLDQVADALAYNHSLQWPDEPFATKAGRGVAMGAGLAALLCLVFLVGPHIYSFKQVGLSQAEHVRQVQQVADWGWACGGAAIVMLILSAVTYLAGARLESVKEYRALEQARAIIEQHTSKVAMPRDFDLLLRQARAARTKIEGAEVWKTELFDNHRVRVDLTEEFDQIGNRLRKLTSIAKNSGSDQATEEARREIIASTRKRVAALEDYQRQVAEADRQYAQLRAAEDAEANTDRMNDLLATTGADPSQIEHFAQLSAESRAAAEAIEQVLTLMSGTVAELLPTKRK